MKRGSPNWKPPSIANLVLRFGLNERHLLDARINQILARKVALEAEIAELRGNGVREARVQRFARILGFSDKELANDPKISQLIQSVLDGRQYLQTMKPKRQELETKNAAK